MQPKWKHKITKDTSTLELKEEVVRNETNGLNSIPADFTGVEGLSHDHNDDSSYPRSDNSELLSEEDVA